MTKTDHHRWTTEAGVLQQQGWHRTWVRLKRRSAVGVPLPFSETPPLIMVRELCIPPKHGLVTRKKGVR